MWPGTGHTDVSRIRGLRRKWTRARKQEGGKGGGRQEKEEKKVRKRKRRRRNDRERKRWMGKMRRSRRYKGRKNGSE